MYSTSSPGMSMAIVRFFVGQDEEKSIVRLNQKLLANFDLIPPGASQPLVKPRSDRKSTRLNSSHLGISYAVFCLKKNRRQPYSVLWAYSPIIYLACRPRERASRRGRAACELRLVFAFELLCHPSVFFFFLANGPPQLLPLLPPGPLPN